MGYSTWGRKESDMAERLSMHSDDRLDLSLGAKPVEMEVEARWCSFCYREDA